MKQNSKYTFEDGKLLAKKFEIGGSWESWFFLSDKMCLYLKPHLFSVVRLNLSTQFSIDACSKMAIQSETMIVKQSLRL